jgi:hypothetical protein
VDASSLIRDSFREPWPMVALGTALVVLVAALLA